MTIAKVQKNIEKFLKSTEFRDNIVDGVLDLRKAKASGDERLFRAALGRWGGITRRLRSMFRMEAVEAYMLELGITPTQHVAQALMMALFGEGAMTAALTVRFAKAGRDAKTKHMDAAWEKHTAEPSRGEDYTRLYDWSVKALDAQISAIKLTC